MIALQMVACWPPANANRGLQCFASCTKPNKSVTMTLMLGFTLIACSIAYLSALPTVCSGPGSPPKIAFTGMPLSLSMVTAQPHLLNSGVSDARPEPSVYKVLPHGRSGQPQVWTVVVSGG